MKYIFIRMHNILYYAECIWLDPSTTVIILRWKEQFYKKYKYIYKKAYNFPSGSANKIVSRPPHAARHWASESDALQAASSSP